MLWASSKSVKIDCPTPRRKPRILLIRARMMSDWEVQLVDDSISEFSVMFKGPPDSNYEGGWWAIRVELPEAYPYKSPSIGFQNKIYHPNVDETAGSVCLDVINQTWTPMYDLVNVFEQFLPQLLLYPNASDPLNGEAASLLLRSPEEYKRKVKEYVAQFATESQARKHDKHTDDDEDVEKDMTEKEADENDGFLPDSDDEEDPPTTGKMTI